MAGSISLGAADADLMAGLREHRHDVSVEIGDRPRPERQRPPPRLALQDERVIDQIERQRERPGGRMHGLGGEAARGDVKGQLPTMVAPGEQGRRHLADHLRE